MSNEKSVASAHGIASPATNRATHPKNERKYPCPECGKRFTRSNDVKRHSETHEPSTKMKHLCPNWPVCGFSARQKSNLEEHLSKGRCTRRRAKRRDGVSTTAGPRRRTRAKTPIYVPQPESNIQIPVQLTSEISQQRISLSPHTYDKRPSQNSNAFLIPAPSHQFVRLPSTSQAEMYYPTIPSSFPPYGIYAAHLPYARSNGTHFLPSEYLPRQQSLFTEAPSPTSSSGSLSACYYHPPSYHIPTVSMMSVQPRPLFNL